MRYEYKIPLVPPSNNKYIGNGGQAKNLENIKLKRGSGRATLTFVAARSLRRLSTRRK